ncbi:MAG: preprotein translocase subunit SecG [Lachnospiraceae bacterium]|nr:preprotein translocase subunit SecG [Lachnospiraceae bacterium]
MAVLHTILTIVFVIICVALAVLVLMQEGKSEGLGALAGGNSDTYWGQNKARSREGRIERITRILAALFFILAIVLNLKIFG